MNAQDYDEGEPSWAWGADAAGAAETAGTAGTTGTAGEADAAGALCVDLEGNILFFQDSEVKAGT